MACRLCLHGRHTELIVFIAAAAAAVIAIAGQVPSEAISTTNKRRRSAGEVKSAM